ncbi:hypothetical protein ISS04_02270 [Candidatus Woesearchaeota archaeon]|nr:hypothetical protein [Candidatus Woesearchaeota archaeon]
MTDQEKINELAETLKSRGLAASMADAIEKAQNIIGGIKPKKEEPKVEVKESVEVKENLVDETQTTQKNVSEDIKEIEKEEAELETKKDPAQETLNSQQNSTEYDITKEQGTLNEVMETKKEEEPTIEIHENQEDSNFLNSEEENSIEKNPETAQESHESILDEPTALGSEHQSDDLDIPAEQNVQSSEPPMQDKGETLDIDDIPPASEELSFIKTIEEEAEENLNEKKESKPNLTEGLMETEPSLDTEKPNEEPTINSAPKPQETPTQETQTTETTSQSAQEAKPDIPKKKTELTEEEKKMTNLSNIFNYGKR